MKAALSEGHLSAVAVLGLIEPYVLGAGIRRCVSVLRALTVERTGKQAAQTLQAAQTALTVKGSTGRPVFAESKSSSAVVPLYFR